MPTAKPSSGIPPLQEYHRALDGLALLLHARGRSPRGRARSRPVPIMTPEATLETRLHAANRLALAGRELVAVDHVGLERLAERGRAAGCAARERATTRPSARPCLHRGTRSIPKTQSERAHRAHPERALVEPLAEPHPERHRARARAPCSRAASPRSGRSCSLRGARRTEPATPIPPMPSCSIPYTKSRIRASRLRQTSRAARHELTGPRPA